MGNGTSKLDLPNENKYYMSCVEQCDYIPYIDLKESIDLSNIIPGKFKIIDIIDYQLKDLGYSVNTKDPSYTRKSTIPELIKNIQTNGLYSADRTDSLSDVVFETQCYYSNLLNIKKLLNKKRMVLAGIILDRPLIKSIEPGSYFDKKVTDIICIVGYTGDNLLIKTSWTTETLELNIKFISNIKELWTIVLKVPEIKIF
uniref:Uncharacterized protein n=1 Tax=viral metagenome TaxID=1070528 RepID=A0A6C0IAM3_9ZZZZ